MGLEIFALMLAGSQLAVYGADIGKSIRDKTKGSKVNICSLCILCWISNLRINYLCSRTWRKRKIWLTIVRNKVITVCKIVYTLNYFPSIFLLLDK